MHMLKVAVVGALLVGCGSTIDGGDVVAPSVVIHPTDAALSEMLQTADAAWEQMGVRSDAIEIGEAADGSVPLVWSTIVEVTARCLVGQATWGCYIDGSVWLAADMPEEWMQTVLEHELGHVLAGGGHAACDDSADGAMCNGTTSDHLTARDAEWVCGRNPEVCDVPHR